VKEGILTSEHGGPLQVIVWITATTCVPKWHMAAFLRLYRLFLYEIS